jgi:sugar phosphate isomerase/epimerase
MKIGLAIAPETASPLAFVVYRDQLEKIMEKVSRLGYDGVELALRDSSEIDVGRVREALDKYGLEIPVISSGRVFAEGKVWFTHPDKLVRREAVETMKGLVRLAVQLGSKVNVGRVRGFIGDGESREIAEARFIECMRECADLASELNVEMLIEPVNRYETNYINSVSDALTVLDNLAHPNVTVMPDVFHMNIEDASITAILKQAGARVGYVHFADSNRYAPGQGHLDFTEIVSTLNEIGYNWYVTAEILPYPDPDTAAANAIGFIRRIICCSG